MGWELFWKKPVKRRVQSQRTAPISEGAGLSVIGVENVLERSLLGQTLERVFVLHSLSIHPGQLAHECFLAVGGH